MQHGTHLAQLLKVNVDHFQHIGDGKRVGFAQRLQKIPTRATVFVPSARTLEVDMKRTLRVNPSLQTVTVGTQWSVEDKQEGPRLTAESRFDRARGRLH